MSTDKRYYLGTYVECKNLVKEVPLMKRICCSQVYIHKNNEFCSTCGSKLELREDGKKSIYEIDIQDIMEDIYESLVCVEALHNNTWEKDYPQYKGKNIWIANKDYNKYASEKDIEVDTFIIEIENFNITQEPVIISQDASSFIECFENEIKILEEKHGRENISIKFGLISYYN